MSLRMVNIAHYVRLPTYLSKMTFLIRMNAAEMIADAGFDVVEAASADEAIVILEDRLDITSQAFEYR